jgi:hypothetical protein
LYIGLAYNTAGTQRLGASEAWYGQASADWPEETNLINFKNIDANGDGIINAADTTVIVHNWTRVINPTIHNPFAAAQGMNGTESQSLIISADTLYEGQSAILPLVLGTQSAPLDSVYGFSFSVSYDPAFIKDNIRFAPGNSWFADNDKYLVLQKNFPEQQRLDVAITRTDGVPASGWGTIGNFFIIIEDNIFGDPNPSLPPDTSLKTLIYFTETQSINSSGNTGVLGETPSELVIKRTAVGVNSTPNLDKTIAIYPSPASNVLHIESHFTSIQKIVLSDMTGQIVGQFMGDTPHWQIPLQALPPGAYFARILSETGTTTKKFIIAR